jgi:hypothetical protein
MAQKPILQAEVKARALRASQKLRLYSCDKHSVENAAAGAFFCLTQSYKSLNGQLVRRLNGARGYWLFFSSRIR